MKEIDEEWSYFAEEKSRWPRPNEVFLDNARDSTLYEELTQKTPDDAKRHLNIVRERIIKNGRGIYKPLYSSMRRLGLILDKISNPILLDLLLCDICDQSEISRPNSESDLFHLVGCLKMYPVIHHIGDLSTKPLPRPLIIAKIKNKDGSTSRWACPKIINGYSDKREWANIMDRTQLIQILRRWNETKSAFTESKDPIRQLEYHSIMMARSQPSPWPDEVIE